MIDITAFRLLLRVLAFYTFFVLNVAADPVKLIPVENFKQLATEAEQDQIPILLLVSQYHCSYCDLMKEEVLQPLQMDRRYRERVLIRELLIDQGEMVINFKGIQEAAADFASQYNVFVTPTLLFLDSNGVESAERIVGINTVDYLIFYIEDAIDSATANLVSKNKLQHSLYFSSQTFTAAHKNLAD